MLVVEEGVIVIVIVVVVPVLVNREILVIVVELAIGLAFEEEVWAEDVNTLLVNCGVLMTVNDAPVVPRFIDEGIELPVTGAVEDTVLELDGGVVVVVAEEGAWPMLVIDPEVLVVGVDVLDIAVDVIVVVTRVGVTKADETLVDVAVEVMLGNMIKGAYGSSTMIAAWDRSEDPKLTTAIAYLRLHWLTELQAY